MINYTFQNPCKLIIGKDTIKSLKEEIKNLNVKKLIILYSGDYIFKLGIYEEIKKICNEENVEIFENGEIVSNPQVDLVRKIIKYVRENSIDLILGVGGGSVIDTAKAVAVGAYSNNDIWDFFLGKENIGNVMNLGIISTLPSSGSEMSNCSIISNENRKLGIEDNAIIPNFVILDPSYTVDIPWKITATGIVDISTHLLERYFSNEENTLVTDYIIEGALKALIEVSKKLKEDIKNYNYRSEICLLSILAHNNMLEIGRVPDWASHRIEHEISAKYNIVHGVGMAIVIPAYIRYLSNKVEDKKVYSILKNVFDESVEDKTINECFELLSEKIESYYNFLGMETKLRKLNVVKEEDFEMMANLATEYDNKKIGHYYPLGSSEIVEILKLAM